MANTELGRLEEVKREVEEIKGNIIDFINDKFEDVFTLINERIEVLEAEYEEDEEEDEYPDLEDTDIEEDEEDEEEEELSIQERVNRSLLSASVRNQLQVVPEGTETPVVASTPTPSLNEIIAKQLRGEATPAPTISLTEQIAQQVSAQQNLTVVAPALSEGPVEVTEPTVAPARPLGEIISELRNDVNSTVESESEETTNELVERAVSSTPDVDSDLNEDLAAKIRQQLLSNEIKKQLS